MNATECIKGRRSIRKFKEDAVDPKLIEEIIETASYAPSWKPHAQGCHALPVFPREYMD